MIIQWNFLSNIKNWGNIGFFHPNNILNYINRSNSISKHHRTKFGMDHTLITEINRILNCIPNIYFCHKFSNQDLMTNMISKISNQLKHNFLRIRCIKSLSIQYNKKIYCCTWHTVWLKDQLLIQTHNLYLELNMFRLNLKTWHWSRLNNQIHRKEGNNQFFNCIPHILKLFDRKWIH